MKLARDKMKEQPLPLHEPSVEVEVLPVAVADGRQINESSSATGGAQPASNP
jgi:hypothetical protein